MRYAASIADAACILECPTPPTPRCGRWTFPRRRESASSARRANKRTHDPASRRGGARGARSKPNPRRSALPYKIPRSAAEPRGGIAEGAGSRLRLRSHRRVARGIPPQRDLAAARSRDSSVIHTRETTAPPRRSAARGATSMLRSAAVQRHQRVTLFVGATTTMYTAHHCRSGRRRLDPGNVGDLEAAQPGSRAISSTTAFAAADLTGGRGRWSAMSATLNPHCWRR